MKNMRATPYRIKRGIGTNLIFSLLLGVRVFLIYQFDALGASAFLTNGAQKMPYEEVLSA